MAQFENSSKAVGTSESWNEAGWNNCKRWTVSFCVCMCTVQKARAWQHKLYPNLLDILCHYCQFHAVTTVYTRSKLYYICTSKPPSGTTHLLKTKLAKIQPQQHLNYSLNLSPLHMPSPHPPPYWCWDFDLTYLTAIPPLHYQLLTSCTPCCCLGFSPILLAPLQLKPWLNVTFMAITKPPSAPPSSLKLQVHSVHEDLQTFISCLHYHTFATKKLHPIHYNQTLI